MTSTSAQQLLADVFAPWIQALNLQVLALDEGMATLVLPASSALARDNGVICGQALMAAADTAMVIAISHTSGAYRPMTTVEQKTTIMRPVIGDARVVARVLRLGKTMAFGQIDIESDGKLAAQATTTYALLPNQ
jgi:uncharacterized protein (TIGR00369 family)